MIKATYSLAGIPTGVKTEVIRVACKVNECVIAKALERSETSGDIRYALKLNN